MAERDCVTRPVETRRSAADSRGEPGKVNPNVSLSEQTPKCGPGSMGHPGNIEIESLMRHKGPKQRRLVGTECTMLWTILVVLCILWLLGMVTSFTAGGLIHILLVAAVVILVFNLVTGRRGTV